MTKAIITGVTGQDGSFLAELLLDKGYDVYGIIRRASNFNTQRIEHLRANQNFHLVFGNLTEGLSNQIYDIQPDEFYNLGAQSHVKVSFDEPTFTFDVNATGVLRILESIRKLSPKTKIYQASSSEMFRF